MPRVDVRAADDAFTNGRRVHGSCGRRRLCASPALRPAQSGHLNDPEWNVLGLFIRGANTQNLKEYVMTGLGFSIQGDGKQDFDRQERFSPGSAAGHSSTNSDGSASDPDIHSGRSPARDRMLFTAF